MVIPTYRKVFCGIVVLVQVDPDAIVLDKFRGLAQLCDKVLHVLHGLFVRLSAHLLHVQGNEGGT